MAGLVDRVRRVRRLRREEGAAAVEFALIAPLLFFLIFGLIWLLLMFAAQLSLGYATNVAVRYAAIPSDQAGTSYPSASQVRTRATEITPFFSDSSCDVPSISAGGVNQPVSLTMDCNFPNPAGSVANAFRQALWGGDEISSTVALSATAQSRKE